MKKLCNKLINTSKLYNNHRTDVDGLNSRIRSLE